MPDLILNPDRKTLRDLVSRMPNAALTEWGNYSIRTQVTARSNQYTFLVSDDDCARPRISRKDYEEIVKLQDEYIRSHQMIEVRGTIGLEDPVRVPASLLVEASTANIAAMQSQLYFAPDEKADPIIKVIYTPNLKPNILSLPTLITVDLENKITRILGTDYFGESKKAGLRLWNKWVYDLGGLALHAGCKTYLNMSGQERSVIIIGLSGTGKTTTTFNSHLGSQPVQDDFCALFPDGRLYASENGCFAKTFGLNEKSEPIIYHALENPDAWLENVAVVNRGQVDYENGSYTTNGRGTFTLDQIEHRPPVDLPEVSHIIILNRNFDVIPAIALLDLNQAAEYFMLGETTGTSAGGQAEAGKFLRVPGTNPFFFGNDELQGERFSQILRQNPRIKVALMNTGCVGGYPDEPHSIKVKISHSSALLEALLADEIIWHEDGSFGFLVPSHEISGVPAALLDPKKHYEITGRKLEYLQRVNDLKNSRNRYLDQFSNF